MGVSAISAVGATYAQNYREVPRYTEAVDRRGIATMRGYRLSGDDLLRRALITRLLCHAVIRKGEIAPSLASTSTITSRRNWRGCSRSSKIGSWR